MLSYLIIYLNNNLFNKDINVLFWNVISCQYLFGFPYAVFVLTRNMLANKIKFNQKFIYKQTKEVINRNWTDMVGSIYNCSY